MTLVVPYKGELRHADALLMRLAEFLGISAMPVPADDIFCGSGLPSREHSQSLVINPEVVRRCLCEDVSLSERMQALRRRFSRILLHCVRSDSFHGALVKSLTEGRVRIAKESSGVSRTLSFLQDERNICGQFAGLSLQAEEGTGDCEAIFAGESGFRPLVTCGEGALLATSTVEQTEILLLGSREVLDLDAEAGDAWLSESLTKLLPHSMALRHICENECWRPAESIASLIIDDPLLRPQYGFLNFARLLRLMDEHNFAATIAFIPHNFRRNSSRTVAMFREQAQRLSICFHGNDHTGAEFTSTSAAHLNAMLGSARARMAAHEKRSRLHCDPIMVFPQGKFSVEAMAALRAHNFDAAVNTGSSPHGQQLRLTFRELAEPAVLRYGGFPLFLRRYSANTLEADIAFRLFFGVPILVVEHHDVFANPTALIDAVDRINRIGSGICWRTAGDAVRRSFLQKRDSDDQVRLKAYARSVWVENLTSIPQNLSIEWASPNAISSLEGAYWNDRRCSDYRVTECGVHVSARLDAAASEDFSIRDIPSTSGTAHFGLRHAARVFVRRRMSELRDNYISKSPALLSAAKSIQRSFQL